MTIDFTYEEIAVLAALLADYQLDSESYTDADKTYFDSAVDKITALAD